MPLCLCISVPLWYPCFYGKNRDAFSKLDNPVSSMDFRYRTGSVFATAQNIQKNQRSEDLSETVFVALIHTFYLLRI